MNKIFKSKIFYGIMLMAFMFVGGAFASTASADCSITTTLKVGSRGVEVQCLQSTLGITADGSFGPMTRAKVISWQASHGLTADGIFGPMSRAALFSVYVPNTTSYPVGCTSNIGYSAVTGASCSGVSNLPAGCFPGYLFSSTTGQSCSASSNNNSNNNSSSNSNTLSGGETSITDLNLKDSDDDTLNEGARKAEVASIQFDVDDADAELVRADIVFQAANDNEENDPWKVFNKAYLMNGSTVLGTVETNNKKNWEKTDDVISSGTNQAYRLRFNNIKKIYKEGSNGNQLWIAVDVNSSVDGSDADKANWTVGIEEDGLRFTDSAKINTEVDTSETADFSIVEAGTQSELTVNKASINPKAQTLQVKETTTSTQTLAVFKVKVDEDGGDVKINDFPITLTIANTGTGDDMAEVVDDVMVVIDGTTYSTDDKSSSTDAVQTFHFSDIEDDDVVIDAGDTINVTVKVKLRSQGTAGANYANGTTIYASADVTNNDVEDADSGDNIGNVNGDADGETMTLAGSGITVEVVSATTDITNVDGSGNDTATFTWKIDVTAFGKNDVYINKDFADIVLSNAANNVDTIYTVEKSGGDDLVSLSGTIVTTSGADDVEGDDSAYGGVYSSEMFYKIASGDKETFIITISGTNQTDTKQVRAYLSNIEFTTDNITAATAEDAKTASIQNYTANIVNSSQTPFKNIQ